MPVKSIPKGFHTVTPFFMVKDAPKFMKFLKKAFDAKEIGCHTMPDGTVMHAQFDLGDSKIMLAEACGKFKAIPMMVHLYVKDTDATYKQAIKAGAKSLQKPADQFYGDRSGGVIDGFGNMWWIGTHIKDVSKKEIEACFADCGKKGK
jgi:PhnB protein